MTEPTKTRGPARSGTKPKKTSSTSRVAVALDGKQRRYLRGLAHDMQPILQVGKAGPTKAFVSELDRALEVHELIKVRALRECPTSLSEVVGLLEKSAGASPVGKVGSVAILYRPRAKNPTIVLPKRKTESEQGAAQ